MAPIFMLYLEVDKVLEIRERDSVPVWTLYRPHIKERKEYGTQRNNVYMATSTFSTNPNKPG